MFISACNRLAYKAVSEFELNKAPGVTLIYGPAGVGKTELLRGLYDRAFAQASCVVMADALAFAQWYAYAAQEDQLPAFRAHYRSANLFIIDRLHLLAGKQKTLEELFHTYEEVKAQGGKLVAALNTDELNLDFLGKRLASRFLSGQVLPVLEPGVEEITGFVEYYLRQKRLIMECEAEYYFAEMVRNFHEASLHIDRFVSFAEQRDSALTLECAQGYWAQYEYAKQFARDPENVLRVSTEKLGVLTEDLLGPRRTQEIAEARQLAIYAIRLLSKASYPEIARMFQKRHSSIIYSCQQVEEKLKVNEKVQRDLKAILDFFDV